MTRVQCISPIAARQVLEVRILPALRDLSLNDSWASYRGELVMRSTQDGLVELVITK